MLRLLSRLRFLALAGLLAALAPAAPAQPAAPADATELLVAMHDRYAGSWYRTLYFTQATSRLTADGSVSTETWREWMALPGRLRIEMGDPEAGNGALFVGDSTYYFQGGALVGAQGQRNDLLTLGFDVYGRPAAETLAILEASGFDLGPVRSGTWDGRPMYVFGSPETKEVWIDAERLVFVRLVEPTPNPGVHQDVRFLDYEPLDGGWIAPTVEVWVDGRKVFWETYSDVRTGFEADPAWFDPTDWGGSADIPAE